MRADCPKGMLEFKLFQTLFCGALMQYMYIISLLMIFFILIPFLLDNVL